MDREAQNLEVDRNFDFFQRNLSKYLPEHAGQYALLRHAQLVGFYTSVRDAISVARERFPDSIYSLQEVTAEPVDLGFFSHAGS